MRISSHTRLLRFRKQNCPQVLYMQFLLLALDSINTVKVNEYKNGLAEMKFEDKRVAWNFHSEFLKQLGNMNIQ